MEDEILTAAEAAALLRIHQKTVYKLAEQGKIPSFRIGRAWRFKRSDLLAVVVKKPEKEKSDKPKRDIGSMRF
jgi:excisionase family DNA binding protein